jgi:trimeric autotransporter adhesin
MRASKIAPLAAAALCGCFNSSSYVPIITAVSPLGIGAKSASVQGLFFTPDTVVFWNGKAQATAFQSATSVQVTLSPGLTDLPGTARLTASTGGGDVSAAFVASISSDRLTLAAISPQQVAAGSGGFTLTLTGTGFLVTSVVQWNGSPLATTFVSTTGLTASVPAALVANAGDGAVQVVGGGCDGADCLDSQFLVVNAGSSTRNSFSFGAQDLAWDATHAALYSSQQGGSSASITAADPATARILTTVDFDFVVSGPVQLSLADQDAFLYAAPTNGTGHATRYALPGLTSAVQVPSGDTALQIAPQPGTADTAAYLRVSGNAGIFDGTTVRANASDVGTTVDSLVWGPDGAALFGVDHATGGLLSFPVDGTGVGAAVHVGSGSVRDHSRLIFDAGTRAFYGNAGETLSEQGVSQGAFATPDLALSTCEAAIDSDNGKAFFACSKAELLTVSSFDLSTLQPVAQITLLAGPVGSQAGPVSRVVRWGSDGLAVSTAENVFFYSGPFIH